MIDREVMQQALDALEHCRVFVTTREKIKHPEGTEMYDEVTEALRARLAQPEPQQCAKCGSIHSAYFRRCAGCGDTKGVQNPEWPMPEWCK